MKIKAWKKQTLAMCVALALFVLCGVSAAAVEDTPQVVMEDREGVVRVISFTQEAVGTGSGFVVGRGNRVFVVTNHHVIEDTQKLYVFYDDGQYVSASVFHDDPVRDLALLKLGQGAPQMKTLTLETEEVDSGIAVYALGYPAAADYFTIDPEEHIDSLVDFLDSVVANKQSMTVTNGIVSAIHESNLIGNTSARVKVLQTNTAINGGNSGGPLINREGRVVGVNTMGITVAESINGCVHVEELVAMLDEAGVKYEGTPEEAEEEDSEISSAPVRSVPAETGGDPLAYLVLFFLAVPACGVLAIVLILRKKNRPAVKGGVTLEAFERGHRKVEEVAAFEMVRAFLEQTLLPMAQYDLNPLFTPANIIIGDDAMALAETSSDARPGAPPPVAAGYSAPECYQGRATQAATVYYVGAVLFTMLSARRPPEGPGRLMRNAPAFPQAGALQALVNGAMEPHEQNRIQTLAALHQAMLRAADAVYAENGYGPPQPGGGITG